MTTSTPFADDIIELTDIVEEGHPLDTSLADFAMNKAVDASSLDQELDALLREADIPSPARADEPEIDFDAVFRDSADHPAPLAPATSAAPKASTPDVDLTDLDTLFDSLDAPQEAECRATPGPITDGPAPLPQAPSDARAAAPSLNLDLDVPGMNAVSTADILELTEDLLAEIPETILGPTTPGPDAEPILPDPLDLDLSGIPLAAEIVPAAQPSPAVPLTAPRQPLSREDLTDFLSRLEALESRPLQQIGPGEIVAALPDTTAGLPLAQALRAEILQDVEGRLSALNPADRMQILREEILDEVNSIISALPSTADLDGLRQSVRDLQDQMSSRPESAPVSDSPGPDLESELTSLRQRVQDQEQSILELQEALAAKDASFDALRGAEDRLRRELEAAATGLQAFLEQQIPAAAARIIREEIQTLVKEMEG